VYAPLLKFLQQQITAENPKKEKASLEEYAQVRLFSHLKDVKDQLVADPENTFWIQNPVSEIAKEGALLPVSLGEQWKLTKTRVTLKKADSPVPEMISQPVGSWSPIAFSREGTACFCRLFEKTVLESAKKEAIDKAQERLASEARLTLMKTLIDEVQKKGAIAVIKKND
jgi:hypothetical protein